MASSVRGKSRTFFNLASSLESRAPIESKDEIPIMREFLQKVLSQKPEVVKFSPKNYDQNALTGFVFTDKACWFARQIRFINNEEANAYKSSQYSDLACTISTAARLLNTYKRKYLKPIVIFVGTRQSIVNGGNGHCVAVILYKHKGKWEAIIKDSLPNENTSVPSTCFKLLKQLHIKQVTFICQLPFEEEVTETHCMKEVYRVIGDVLDGKYPEHLQKFQHRIFDVSRKHETGIKKKSKSNQQMSNTAPTKSTLKLRCHDASI